MNDHAKERFEITTGFMRQIVDEIEVMRRACENINDKVKVVEHILGGIYERNAKTSKVSLYNETILFQILRYHGDVLALINEMHKEYEALRAEEEKYRQQNAVAGMARMPG